MVDAKRRASTAGQWTPMAALACSGGRLQRQAPRPKPRSLPGLALDRICPARVGAYYTFTGFGGRYGVECSRRRVPRVHKATESASSGVGIFPAGGQQAKVRLPALLLRVSASEILSEDGVEVLEMLSGAIAGGATGVVLGEEGIPGKNGGAAGGGEIYETACALKEVIRGRASLLIVDRPDLAQAASADGVVLTPRGVPVAVARKALKGDSVLVARTAVSPGESARVASEGASFVVLKAQRGAVPKVEDMRQSKTSQKGGSIPVIAELENVLPSSLRDICSLVDAGIDGLLLDVTKLNQTASACGVSSGAPASEAAQAIIHRLELGMEAKPSEGSATVQGPVENVTVQPTQVSGQSREDLVVQEKELLSRVSEFLQEVVPELEEVSLLAGAQKQLDDLFLIVVVGEYNSGKSAVINALLGDSFLEEGILPTTNEISVLRYNEKNQRRKERDSDGCVIQYLPASLLQIVNVVDTPGTNVILERQQRLTEEYVPRADMVLFVMSADRPFTESEVKFLQYIRKWGKKVVFVVNKVDILSASPEVDEVQMFVGENAKSLLNLNEVAVWPVSAKKAISAKQRHGNGTFGGLFRGANEGKLEQDKDWQESGFPKLEAFVTSFFTGDSGAASTESVRLKLQTPVFVADALLDACRQQLENERLEAENDLKAVNAVRTYMRNFTEEMMKDGEIQRMNIRKALDAVVARAEDFVDDTLKLSNLTSLQPYLSKSESSSSQYNLTKGFGSVVMGSVVEDVQKVMTDHGAWLARNCENQVNNYESFAMECAGRAGKTLDDIMEMGQPRVAAKESAAALNGSNHASKPEPESLGALEDVELELGLEPASLARIIDTIMEESEVGVELAERLMDLEIKKAVVGTAGTALAAVGIGFTLTFLLPYTSEDFLAIALSLLLGYVAVLNLPLRRADVKGNARRVGKNLGKELSSRLQNDLDMGLEDCNVRVLSMVGPLEEVFRKEVGRVDMAESKRSELFEELEGMKKRIASLE